MTIWHINSFSASSAKIILLSSCVIPMPENSSNIGIILVQIKFSY